MHAEPSYRAQSTNLKAQSTHRVQLSASSVSTERESLHHDKGDEATFAHLRPSCSSQFGRTNACAPPDRHSPPLALEYSVNTQSLVIYSVPSFCMLGGERSIAPYQSDLADGQVTGRLTMPGCWGGASCICRVLLTRHGVGSSVYRDPSCAMRGYGSPSTAVASCLPLCR